MAEIPLWQSLLTTIAAAAATGWVGVLWGRSHERIKWEEQSAAELRKARIEAILAIAHALGKHHRASVKALVLLADVGTKEPAEDDRARVLEALRRRSETARELLDVTFTNLFLVPPELRAVLQRELALITGAETPEASRDATSRMAVAIEEYLPPMRKLQRAIPLARPPTPAPPAT